MALMLPQKKKTVDQLAKIASQSTSVIAADFKGLKSRDMIELRARVRSLPGCHLKVVRNTLAKKAFAGTSYEQLVNKIQGQLILAFIKDEPSLVAKMLREFVKEKEKLAVSGLLIEGRLLAANQLDVVASLPSKQEALTSLVTVMQAPIVKFVRTLAEPVAKLTRTLAAVSEVK